MNDTSEERDAAIYASKGGAETNALQVTLCQGYGRAYHLTIQHCYEDREQERTALQRLLEAAHLHTFVVVLVTTPDRLATDEDERKQVLAELQGLGIEVVFVLAGEHQEGSFL